MFVRVVRFTDVSSERLDSLLGRIRESDGPPPGVDSNRIQFLVDESHDTAVVLQYFETAEAMEAAGQVLSAMDPGETPGDRASVDACELKLELTAP